jgi:recombination protein RecA
MPNVTGQIIDEKGTGVADVTVELVQSGAYYSWKGERIAQGRDKACQYMAEHPDVMDELRSNLVEQRKDENARMGAPIPAVSGESEAA